ncbi:NAD-dependent epimerase/dehydratase family protein [Sphingomonas sp. PB4P5]|uniref:NAD-dependent epimerase/dehydratase family protein n=1 Tax=Parasphingomonas puruogangriensis TaxID=3096155 RepID=UPI002FC60714
MSETVLVTGATGGLGSVLVDALLAAGRDVIATGRDRSRGATLQRHGARFIAADLVHDDSAPLLVGVGTVIHLAALSSPWGPRAAFVAANLTATERLLAAARTAGVKRFLFASTPSIYTRARTQLHLTEDTPLPVRPINAYAATKLAAEHAVRAAAGIGFATVTLRPRAVIGPRDTVLLPRLIHAARTGVMPLPGRGRALIEPTDARDVGTAFLAAEARAEAVSGRAFNISGGRPIPLADLAAHAFHRLGRAVRLVPIPARLALGLAHLAEAVARIRPGAPEPALTVYAATALGWSQTFDLAAARAALGWAPIHDPFAAIDWALAGQRADA